MSRDTADPTDAVLAQEEMRELSSRAKALSELLELGSTLRDADRYAVQRAAAALSSAVDQALSSTTKKEGTALPEGY